MTPELVPPLPDPSKWALDRRVAIAGALGLVGLGLIIGFHIRGGVPDLIEVPSPRPAPCTDCAERAIKDARGPAAGPPVSPSPASSSNGTTAIVTAGDSSVPDD